AGPQAAQLRRRAPVAGGRAGAAVTAIAETQAPWPARGSPPVTRVRGIVAAEPGLYGLGCATFTQRFAAVVTTLEQHVAPLLIGRHPADINDITRMLHFSSYWRSGPVLNSALSGVDTALWDIAGKRA